MADTDTPAGGEGQFAPIEQSAVKEEREETASKSRQIAVALSYEETAEDAPRVIAKGYGERAEKILRLAFENDVKVRHDPDLAQILAAVEVDCEIPVEAFAAVAEILTYIYSANERVRAGEEK